MSHPWKSRGDKRTIVGRYEPQEEVMKYLTDMQNAIRYAIEVAYEMAIRDHNRIPSPIALKSSRGSCQTTIMRLPPQPRFRRCHAPVIQEEPSWRAEDTCCEEA
ncbi:MAG: hypothetical protein QXH66_05725 [Conexivisphaerales archaeon]